MATSSSDLNPKEDIKINAESQKTVIVVGAGIAGVQAALALTQKGHPVVLIEARDYVGGRAVNNKDGIPLGATYIHDAGSRESFDGTLFTSDDVPKDHPIPLLLAQQKIPNKPIKKTDYFNQIKFIGSNMAAVTSTLIKECGSAIFTYERRGAVGLEASTYGFLAKAIARDISISYEGIDWDDMFQKSKTRQEKNIRLPYCGYDGGDILVGNPGYQAVVQDLYNQANNTGNLKTLLNSPITEIDCTAKKAKVVLKSGETIEADAVLCSLPIGVLQKNVVKIVGLSDKKKEAIAHMAVAVQNKVLLTFDKLWWTKDPFLSVVDTTKDKNSNVVTTYVNVNYFFPDLQTPTLMVSYYGNAAKVDEKTLDEQARATLKAAYPDEPEPISSIATQWHTDPYALGSWANTTAATLPEDVALFVNPGLSEKPEASQAFFTLIGDCTVVGLNGSFHGAYLSGKRGARLANEHLVNLSPEPGIEGRSHTVKCK